MNESVDPPFTDTAALASADPVRPGGVVAAPTGEHPSGHAGNTAGMTGAPETGLDTEVDGEVPLLSEVVEVSDGAGSVPAVLQADGSLAAADPAAALGQDQVHGDPPQAADQGAEEPMPASPPPAGSSVEARAEAPPVSAAAVVPDLPAKPAKTRKRPKPGERRLQILQALAEMLEQPKGERVTTAALAAKLSVSEAALYRHFASKAQMFEGLIEFIESTLFGLINQIASEEENALKQVQQVLNLLLSFAERNPGMTRVLVGDALINEDDRLQLRINQLIDRLELSLKQCYRQAVAQGALPDDTDPAARADLALSYVLGRWTRYAKGGFKRMPTESMVAQMAYFLS